MIDMHAPGLLTLRTKEAQVNQWTTTHYCLDLAPLTGYFCFFFGQDLCGTYTFLIFLVLMVIFLAFVYLKVPETKNKTFEEIAHQFSPGGDIEVEEMVNDDVFEDIPMANDEGETEDHRLVTLNFDKKGGDSRGLNSKVSPTGEEDVNKK